MMGNKYVFDEKTLVASCNRLKISQEKLLEFGFIEGEKGHVYTQTIADGQLEMSLSVFDGKVYANVLDLSSMEEYVLYRVESATGAFVGRVREEFEQIIRRFFEFFSQGRVYKTAQTNEVAKYIEKRYSVKPEFPWNDDNSIFRHKHNNKWFAAILKISAKKLGLDSDDILEAVNVKMKPEDVEKTVDGKHFFAAYHMNKKHWITIPFGNFVETERICAILDDSYVLTK